MTEFVGDIELGASHYNSILNEVNSTDHNIVDSENDHIDSQYISSIFISMSIIAFIGGAACWYLHNTDGYYTNVPLGETVNVHRDNIPYGSIGSTRTVASIAVIEGTPWYQV